MEDDLVEDAVEKRHRFDIVFCFPFIWFEMQLTWNYLYLLSLVMEIKLLNLTVAALGMKNIYISVETAALYCSYITNTCVTVFVMLSVVACNLSVSVTCW